MKVNFKKIKGYFAKKASRIESIRGWFSNLKKLIFLILGYGFLINTMLWSLFGYDFNFFSLVGYGILYYFIKEEFSEWFRRLFPERRVK